MRERVKKITVTQRRTARGAAVASEPAALLPLNGNLDQVRPDGAVEGWCWSPDQPDVHRIIAVLVDGAEAGTAICNQTRSDLAGAGVGDGAHSFHMLIDAAARPPGVTAVVSLRELATGQLFGGEVSVTWSGHWANHAPVRAEKRPADLAAASEPLGNVDGVTKDGRVSGWCWYADQPDHQVRLELLVDDEVVGVTDAANYRPDLHQAGIGNGAHGFSFALPWSVLSGKGQLTIAVRDAATSAPLGQPMTLRLGRMAGAEDRMAELERQIRSMRDQIAQLKSALDTQPEDRGASDLYSSMATMFQELARGDTPEALGEQRPALREAITALQRRHRPFTLDIPEHPLATIAVPAVIGMAGLHRCLEALREAGVDRHAEIVLVDDAARSARGHETALLPSIVRNLRYLRLDEGADIASCLNELARSAHTNMLVYLDPRVFPETGWLEALANTMGREADAAVIGSRVIGRDGLLRHAGLLTQAQAWPTAFGVLTPAGSAELRFLRPIEAVGALAFGIRRAALLEAGGFQPGFTTSGHAALDLCLRLRAAGHAILLQPAAAALCDDAADLATAVPDLGLPSEDTSRILARWFAATAPALPAVRFVGHALIIDNEIPRPNRDAGSVSAMEQMLLLRRLGYRVTFAAAGGGQEVEADASFLQHHGIEVVQQPSYTSVSDYLTRCGLELDLVQVYRYMNAAMFLDRVRTLAPNAKLIFSPADLHHVREMRHANLRGLVNTEAATQAIRDQELHCIRQSDATILNSDFEFGLLSGEVAADKLRLLRWVSHPSPSTRGFATRSGIGFIGSFRHGPNDDGVSWFVETVMPQLRSLRPGIVLHIAGSDMPERVRALAADDVVVHGWVDDLADLFANLRLTVAPLRYGAGFKGKVATSLAHGVPVVGTTVAFEGTGLVEGFGIAVADQASEIAAQILRLHDDEALWQIASQRALDSCRSLYSPEAALGVYRGLLEDFGLPANLPPATAMTRLAAD